MKTDQMYSIMVDITIARKVISTYGDIMVTGIGAVGIHSYCYQLDQYWY